ncbi:MAG: hypothetical protein MJY92_06995 [Bacteroidales bacterium]|nr:hypothetical protein [Bacteroidales bacterium]
MTGYFKVAGHCFGISLPDASGLWAEMQQQYAPFAVEKADDQLLFHLELVDNMPETGALKCLYNSPTADGETVVKLYKGEGVYLFETSPDHRIPTAARIIASEDFSSASLQILSHPLFSLNNAAMLLYAFASAGKKTVEMHASVILNGGKSYLFLGKSGTGKSTHSRLWLKHIPGSELMNDDNPVVRILDDGSVVAYGTPWSGKTPCYKNMEAPVGAFVQLKQAPQNSIRKASVLDAYVSLFSSISGIKNDNSRMADDLNASISAIIKAVPLFNLDCLPDEAAAQLCHSTVSGQNR